MKILRVLFGMLAGMLAGTAMAEVPEISSPDALKLSQAGELTIIDVRTPMEWKQTGIPKGAWAIELSSDFAERVERRLEGRKDAPVAVICRSGHRSTQAATFLVNNGFTNVRNIREGMGGGSFGPGWIARGLPVQAPQ